jgi:hypothetical protein
MKMKSSLWGFLWAGVTAASLLVTPLQVNASEIVAFVPGNTVVQDPADDLLLVNCDVSQPDHPCSLPPETPLPLPGWFDIKTAKVTEIGGGRVDFFIALYEPVPATPPVPFLSYFWTFQDGCIDPSPTDKDGIRVNWDGDTWSANWFVITSCNPRTIVHGDPVDFRFTEDGILVRVSLADLLTKGGTPLLWYAGVRRLPFVHPIFTHTVGVDFAPDVTAFNPTPPPILIHPEDPAIWEPR